MMSQKKYCPLSIFHLFLIGSVQVSVILLFINPALAALPVLLLIVITLSAPFIPGFGFFLPVISHGDKKKGAVSLTFDDGPDPDVTPEILKLLSRYSIKATFFVTGSNASKYPDIINKIISGGHAIGNHSFSHDPILMLRSAHRLRHEIESAGDELKKYGINPYAFRPPAGITNPRLRRVLLELGLYCVTFNRRAFDAGNRRIKNLAGRILKRTGAGDIILLHDTKPPGKNTTEELIVQIEAIIRGIKAKGIDIAELSALIGKKIMETKPVSPSSPAESFYNQHALIYDEEQFNTRVGTARKKEYGAVIPKLREIISPSDRVLEIGAGTGLYTIPIAKTCREIVALDISGNMLDILEQKAEKENLSNIKTISADIEEINIQDKFDVICSFSCFEYIADFPRLIKSVAKLLKPGGVLYFTTAHRSFFRFFTQVGNALRQGIWLRARGRNEIIKILSGTKFLNIQISTYLFKSFISGGMLIEVIANKNIDDSSNNVS